MEAYPHNKIMGLISGLNSNADRLDKKIADMQSAYASQQARNRSLFENAMSRLNSECDAAIKRVKNNELGLIRDAEAVLNEIMSIENKLLAVDKYYNKTKRKKMDELRERTAADSIMEGDYFAALNEIKKQFAALSKKYYDRILPGILNGLNFLLSSKRKQDYEELIVLQNTVVHFLQEIKAELPGLTKTAIDSILKDFAAQKNSVIARNNRDKAAAEQGYKESAIKLSDEIDDTLQKIIPERILSELEKQKADYESSLASVNSSQEIKNGVMNLTYLSYPVRAFVRSEILSGFIEQRYSSLMRDGSVQFPFMQNEESMKPFFFVKGDSDTGNELSFIHSMLFSYLATVPVGQLKINVIDCERHGNSMTPFFGLKNKMPGLFGGKFVTGQEEIADRIREINEYVEYVTQDILGTTFANIYEYKKNDPENEFKTQVLVIFDFPSGLDELSLSHLCNIVKYGGMCGIQVIISYKTPDTERMSANAVRSIEEIKKSSIAVSEDGEQILINGLEASYYALPRKNELNAFFEKYLIINEGIKNKGIAFPSVIKSLIESRDEAEFEENVKVIDSIISEYNDKRGTVNEDDKTYNRYIPIGMTHYHSDIFNGCIRHDRLTELYKDKMSRIALPLMLDLSANANLIVSYEDRAGNRLLPFTHNIMWSFLSLVPATKVNICVFDSYRKDSMRPFFDFFKECPDVFDEKIYTDQESMYERLTAFSRNIDTTIQEKLGTRYNDLLEYNRDNGTRAVPLTLLVIYDFPSGFDSRSISVLENIMKNGSKCGIYTVLCYNRDVRYSEYQNIGQSVEVLASYACAIDINDKSFVLTPFNLPVTIREMPEYSAAEAFIRRYKQVSDMIKKRGLGFSDILDKELFARDAGDKLSIPIGVGDGEKIVNIVFGQKSSHHALVAGATGAGKSTLYHTLIMSAMLHYTPDELNLYLMDFKGGTEFKVYDTARLPHIKLLALDAMQEFGESILENLVEEIGKRSDSFKKLGVSKLSEYKARSDEPMPRILIIMDEFQILFNDATNRKVANNCAELTKRIITEGRSYGIHLLMATQSTKIITDLTLSPGAIEQMRIRIGMKCGSYDTHYLFSDLNEDQAAELMKGPIGTAVINEDYTEKNNTGFRVAYCDDSAQLRYIADISQKMAGYKCDTKSFEGGKTTPLLHYIAENGLAYSTSYVEAHIGQLIKVADPFKVRFDRMHRHNTLICGSNEKMVTNITDLYLLSVLMNGQADCYYIDGERLLGEIPADCSSVYSDEFEKFNIVNSRGEIVRLVTDVYDYYTESKKRGADRNIFIVVKNIQFIDIIKTMLKAEPIDESEYIDAPDTEVNGSDDSMDMFDFGLGGGSSVNVSDKLLKLIEEGVAYGIHFIFTSLEYQTVKECMYYGENSLAKFPERYIFSLNNDDADSLISGVQVSSLRDNTVYYSDSIKNTFQLKPYVFPDADELREYIRKSRAEI